jgi:ATP-dependent Clp protease ATP-binding subunit ClpC
MFLSFNDAARLVMRLADCERQRLHHDCIGTEHLLLALVQLHGCVAARVLAKGGISLDRVRKGIEDLVGAGPAEHTSSRRLTAGSEKSIALAIVASERLGQAEVGTGHLLLGLLEEAHGVAFRVLCKLGIGRLGGNLSRIAEHVIREMKRGVWAAQPRQMTTREHLAQPGVFPRD